MLIAEVISYLLSSGESLGIRGGQLLVKTNWFEADLYCGLTAEL